MNQSSHLLRQRLTFLRWGLPLGFALSVVLYQLGPMRWVHNTFGHLAYFSAETVFYALVSVLITFWMLASVDRWLAEKEQAESLTGIRERRLAAILTASADAILSIDADGVIESWNRGAELLFGYEAAKIQGRPFSVLLEGGAATKVELGWLKEMVHQQRIIRGHETVCRDVDGHAINVELTATLLTNEQGGPSGMSIILRDITHRKRREERIQQRNASLNEQIAARTHELTIKVEELVQANAALQKLNQTRSEFVSLLSHQIRAPLTNMSGALQRMQTDCQAVNPTCSRMFAIYNQQITRLDRLVQDVLNASRLEAGEMFFQPEPISVLPVMQQVVEQIETRTADRLIQLPTKPGLPLIYADRDRVAEILVNLLDNADKYSPPGQEISVEVRADQTEVTIAVRDCGPGLPPEDLEHVFDKFYRTDSSDSQAAYGYGLGLYVCHHLVKAQDGRIWAENHPDGGAIFSFTLPVWQG